MINFIFDTKKLSKLTNSGVAPPVTSVRIRVNAESLKYVVDIRESRTEMAFVNKNGILILF